MANSRSFITQSPKTTGDGSWPAIVATPTDSMTSSALNVDYLRLSCGLGGEEGIGFGRFGRFGLSAGGAARLPAAVRARTIP